jgi:hypothetical protein
LRVVSVQLNRPEQEIAGLFEYFAALRLAGQQQGASTKEVIIGVEIAGAATGLAKGARSLLQLSRSPAWLCSGWRHQCRFRVRSWVATGSVARRRSY